MPAPKNIEKREIVVDNIELRSEGEGEQRFVEGLGIVYDKEVELWDGYFEKIHPEAFTRCLKSGEEIKSYFNHDPDFVLSTTRSKPALELYNTTEGLRFRSPIPPTSYGNDLIINLERKNVRGASFSFFVEDDVITVDEKGRYHRHIIKGEIFEVGPVTNPAYSSAKVGVRSKEEMFKEAETRCRHPVPESESIETININKSEQRKKLLTIHGGI